MPFEKSYGQPLRILKNEIAAIRMDSRLQLFHYYKSNRYLFDQTVSNTRKTVQFYLFSNRDIYIALLSSLYSSQYFQNKEENEDNNVLRKQTTEHIIILSVQEYNWRARTV